MTSGITKFNDKASRVTDTRALLITVLTIFSGGDRDAAVCAVEQVPDDDILRIARVIASHNLDEDVA